MRVGEQQPVLAIITHDNPDDAKNLRHLAWWATEEQNYDGAYVLNSTFSSRDKSHAGVVGRLQLGGNTDIEVEDVYTVKGPWAQRNHALKVAKPLARKNPLLHFLHASTIPNMLSHDRAPDILRATQDIPRLVGGFVCNAGKGHIPDSYEMVSNERDPFKSRTLDEIAEYTNWRPDEPSPLATTYPIHWAHPFNLAVPYNAFVKVGGFPDEEDSPRKLSRQLASKGVLSILSPLIAMHITSHKSDAAAHTNFAEPEDDWPVGRRRRTAAAMRGIATARSSEQPGQPQQNQSNGRGRRRRRSDNP